MQRFAIFALLLVVNGITLAGESSILERMHDYANYVCDKVRIENRRALPELNAAAQAHAEHLAHCGYGAYAGVRQPNAHDGWGDGNAYSRAAKHGFTGSVSCDDPRISDPRHRVTGEIIYCGNVPLEKAFESWQKHDSGHWIPLTSSEFDVAGFGHATNKSGQHIYVGMFGNTRLAAEAQPQPVGFQQTFPSCGPGGYAPQPTRRFFRRR